MSVEQFIRDHREAFDSEAPSLRVWEAIAKQLPPEQQEKQLPKQLVKRSLWRNSNLTKLAAAIALLVIGLGIGMRIGAGRTTDAAVAGAGAEYEEAASFYQRDISSKKEKLAKFASQNEEIAPDLIQLEQVMAELKNELANVPPARRQEVLAAMIENYKTRASILEKVLSHIEQQQHTKESKDEPTNI
jgi:hypothetical protein